MTAQPWPSGQPAGRPAGVPWPANTPGRLRVSQAEREAIAEQLRQHTSDGRLSLDEFGERLDACLKAKTYDELAQVLRDLPALHPTPVTNEPPPRVQRSIPPHVPLLVAALVAAVAAALVTQQVFPFIFLAIWCAVMVRRAYRRGCCAALPPARGPNTATPDDRWSRQYPPNDKYRGGPHHHGYDQEV